MLFSLLGSLLELVMPVLGIVLLIAAVYTFFAIPKDEMPLERGPAFLWLGILAVHVFIFYQNRDSELWLLEMLVQCLLPAAIAMIVAGTYYHGFAPTKLAQCIAVGVTYAVTFIVTCIFSNMLVEFIVLLVVMGVLIAVFTHLGNQQLMDIHTNDAHGDHEEVARLYKKGYRPSDYYKGAEREEEAKKKLVLHHGIDPDEVMKD